MAVTLTITPQTTALAVTNNTTTLTISSAVAGAATDSGGITYTGNNTLLSSQNNVENALNFLADQHFQQQSCQTA